MVITTNVAHTPYKEMAPLIGKKHTKKVRRDAFIMKHLVFKRQYVYL